MPPTLISARFGEACDSDSSSMTVKTFSTRVPNSVVDGTPPSVHHRKGCCVVRAMTLEILSDFNFFVLRFTSLLEKLEHAALSVVRG